jgi:hypothetical protein
VEWIGGMGSWVDCHGRSQARLVNLDLRMAHGHKEVRMCGGVVAPPHPHPLRQTSIALIDGPSADELDRRQHLSVPFGQQAHRWPSSRPSATASGPALSDSRHDITRMDSDLRTPPLQDRALPPMRNRSS